jgi:opacity protein-like surface antigen
LPTILCSIINGLIRKFPTRPGREYFVIEQGKLSPPPTARFDVSRRVTYLGTVRGRLGLLATPTFLVYGTAGLAYGGVRSSMDITRVFAGNAAVGPAFSTGGVDNTRVG